MVKKVVKKQEVFDEKSSVEDLESDNEDIFEGLESMSDD